MPRNERLAEALDLLHEVSGQLCRILVAHGFECDACGGAGEGCSECGETGTRVALSGPDLQQACDEIVAHRTGST